MRPAEPAHPVRVKREGTSYKKGIYELLKREGTSYKKGRVRVTKKGGYELLKREGTSY